MKKPVQHFDKLGRELVIGDCVAYSSRFIHGVAVGRITELKRVRAVVMGIYIKPPEGILDYSQGQYHYESIASSDMIKLDAKDVTFKILQSK